MKSDAFNTQELKDAIKELKKHTKDMLQPLLFKSYQQAFDTYPNLEYIRFTITDSCYDDENYYTGIDNIDIEGEDDDDLYDAVYNVDADIIELAFGLNVTITVNRNGFEVKKYHV